MTDEQLEYNRSVAMSALLINAPFFASALYELGRLHFPKDGMWQGVQIPTAMTDGRNAVFNAEFLFSLNIGEQVFVLAHEAVHKLAGHPTRFRYYKDNGFEGQPFDHELANIAADAVINKLLRECAVGQEPSGAINLDKYLADEFGYAITGLEPFEDIYRMLASNKTNPPPRPKEGKGLGSGDVADPTTLGDEEPASETERKAVAKTAIESAKSIGKLPGALKQFIDEFLETRIPWREHLHAALTAAADSSRYTWNRPNRRKLVMPGVYLPRTTGVSSGVGVIAIDTSASCYRRVPEFLSEAAAILSETHPTKIYVVWCDAAVDRVDEVDSADELLELVMHEGAPGGGGTSFVPPFKWMQDNEIEPHFVVYMTDGYGPFPQDDLIPDCPLIWLIDNNHVTPSSGETIRLLD